MVKYLLFTEYVNTKKRFYFLTLLAHARILKPCPLIVISSFTVPVEGVMLLIDGETQCENSKSNWSVFLTLVSFRPHKGSVARQPAAVLAKCEFSGPALDKRAICKPCTLSYIRTGFRPHYFFLQWRRRVVLTSGYLGILLAE